MKRERERERKGDTRKTRKLLEAMNMFIALTVIVSCIYA